MEDVELTDTEQRLLEQEWQLNRQPGQTFYDWLVYRKARLEIMIDLLEMQE